jgi:hypothetical protein
MSYHRISRSLALTLGLLALAPVAACDGDPSAGPADAAGSAGQGAAGTSGGPDGGAAGTGAAGTGAGSSQTLSFAKDGAPVAVDFSKWGTPAYYQKTSAGWTLAVVANEVSGTAKRYVSVLVRAQDGNELAVAEYPCAADANGPKVVGQITYSEDGMNRVWKQAAGSPCKIAITEIGALGAHLKGTFSATLKPTKGATEDVVVTNGVFDVVRKEY